MAHRSAIEWTMSTWNPWHGCHKVSQGCKNCYMFRDKARYGQDPNVVVRSKTKFYDPLKWKEPRTIFTCSWSDFFIEEADPWRDEAFAIMALTPQHTYQVLTKRPDRMQEYFRQKAVQWTDQGISEAAEQLIDDRFHDFHDQGIFRPHLQKAGWLWDDGCPIYDGETPLPNVWLGVSVEDQATADERIPLLLQTPAALRWLSIEPLLGPVSLTRLHTFKFRGSEMIDAIGGTAMDFLACLTEYVPKIDWVVVGGESGPDARPMHPDWARSLRDQCTAAGVPFFFKQWGEWYAGPRIADERGPYRICRGGEVETFEFEKYPDHFLSFGLEGMTRRVGKKAAGRILDGRTWDEMPEVSR